MMFFGKAKQRRTDGRMKSHSFSWHWSAFAFASAFSVVAIAAAAAVVVVIVVVTYCCCCCSYCCECASCACMEHWSGLEVTFSCLSAFIRSSGRLRFGRCVGLHLLMYKTRACLLMTVPVLCVCAQRAQSNVCIRICASEAFGLSCVVDRAKTIGR